MKPGLKRHQGHPAGRDPREMTRDELRKAGYEPMSPLQALRARCLDCCGYLEKEVTLCPAVDCPSWPFRMGTDPWRKPASEARREAARRAMTRLEGRSYTVREPSGPRYCTVSSEGIGGGPYLGNRSGRSSPRRDAEPGGRGREWPDRRAIAGRTSL
jgi:hypothetical protein